jgi:hypothetical protein
MFDHTTSSAMIGLNIFAQMCKKDKTQVNLLLYTISYNII